jgi:hypothetical protein
MDMDRSNNTRSRVPYAHVRSREHEKKIRDLCFGKDFEPSFIDMVIKEYDEISVNLPVLRGQTRTATYIWTIILLEGCTYFEARKIFSDLTGINGALVRTKKYICNDCKYIKHASKQ